MRVLYAGDSAAGGPANYLLGVLRSLRARVVHVPPSAVCRPGLFHAAYDAVILSDFPRRRLPAASEHAILRHVAGGGGLLMVGGWGSFAGPHGGWRGSSVEALLPVRCLNRDDRVNFPGGAVLLRRAGHPALRGVPPDHPPVICGLNAVRPKPGSRVILAARPVAATIRDGGRSCRVALAGCAYPVLVTDGDPKRRVAAFLTDAAPHWCGGLVDWGRRPVRLSVTRSIQVEVGERYLRFWSNLIGWLARRPSPGHGAC